MSRIPDAFIDELLARTDIVALIGERIELKRAGREFHARCPFHDERTPSFTVSPAKQFYHCFGCAAHGTALRFLMEYERLEFLDAIEDLAQRAGLTVPRETQTRHSQGFEDLYVVLDSAAAFFREHLVASEAASTYLSGRGVDADTRDAFALGYAPDAWDAIKGKLGGDERRIRLLERVGLLSRSDTGRVYDKFRDRLMFPIEDRRGRVIAFGGRVIGVGEPKYLNSPETPLFHKGRELYGLHRARQAQVRLDRLLVVEGYMDVVSLAQSGITEAVATLGTAVTGDQVELMFRSAQDVYFCFDGDRAGRAAAWRAVENTLPRMRDGRQAHFLFLPEGDDPDSVVRREGATALEARLREAMPLSQFFFEESARDINLQSLEGRARLSERIKPMLEKIPDGAFRDLMRERAAESVGVRRVSVESPSLPPGGSKRPSSRTSTRVAPPSLVRTAITLIVQQPSLAHSLAPPYRFAVLRQPGIELLSELIRHAREHAGVLTGMLLEQWDGREEHPALLKLAALPVAAAPEQWEAEFLDALGRLDAQTLQQQIDDLLLLQRERVLTASEKSELRSALEERSRAELSRPS